MKKMFLSLLLLPLLALACSLTNRVENGPAPSPTPPAEGNPPVNFYLILQEDAGRNGAPVGCDDSIVAVEGSESASGDTVQDVQNALGELLALRVTSVQGGYYNALGSQGLSLADVTLQDGDLTVNLAGRLQLSGVCEDARLQYQLLYTIFQYPGFERAFVYVGGRNLKQMLDASGMAGETSPFLRTELPSSP